MSPIECMVLWFTFGATLMQFAVNVIMVSR